MISSIVSRLVILLFGTLYPAYASYKAVRTRNVKEYVKWMMYWIVFALFTCAETFTDVFFSFWFPFYYEIKIILVIWLLSPATKGSSILYRRFVHPALIRREAEIDDALARATEQGYSAVLHLGTKGVNYATTVLMQTAIKNLPSVVPLNSLPASQSDSAISSLANPRASSSMPDTVDGVATRRVRTSRRRINSEDGISIGAVLTDLQDVTTDEEENEDSYEPLGMRRREKGMEEMEEEEEEEDDETTEKDAKRSPPVFKVPQKQVERRKQKKDSGMRRTARPRSCKEAFKHYEADFSDEVDLEN